MIAPVILPNVQNIVYFKKKSFLVKTNAIKKISGGIGNTIDSNNDIIDSNCIRIINRFKSKLSTILIKNKNHHKIHKLKIPPTRIISFKKRIDFLIEKYRF